MRITDNMTANDLAQNIQTSLSNLNTVTTNISSGHSLSSPSQNPTGTNEVLSLSESLLGDTQYENDATNASSILSAGSSALTNVGTILNSVNQIALEGANTGADSSQTLSELAEQVGNAIQQVTQQANTNVGGKYIFGGTVTGSAPYTGNPPTYQGNEEAMTATIGPNSTITLNTPGANASLFSNTLSTLQTLQSDLQSGNSAAISNDVTAVQNCMSSTSDANATLGMKTNQVTAAQQNLQQLDTEYQSTQSSIEDTDLATAAVQLQNDQNVYQASLIAVSDAYKYTLADYLS